MEETKKLAQILVGLYKHVRILSEAYAGMSFSVEAMHSLAKSSDPDFEQKFAQMYAACQTTERGRLLAATLQAIDGTIAALQHDYGPWLS